jgi:uncharacterized iron-regulated protein
MLIAVLAIAQTDPYLLEVNGAGTIPVEQGLYHAKTGRAATLQDLVAAAKDVRFVFVGESHDQADHHKFQAAVVQALHDAGRDVVVGFEMFTRDNQPNLAPWTTGRWTKEQFVENANWKSQWGFDFALYEPIFDAVRKDRLPMVALNVPRDWVRTVGRQGLAALTEEQRKWVPDPYLGNDGHKAVFTALMGGHPMTGPQGDNIYAAQVTWDEGMATSALDYMATRPNRNAVMVVVAGSGHMMYGQGINYRITRKTGEPTLDVMCLTSDGPREVSKGLGHFVFVSKGQNSR